MAETPRFTTGGPITQVELASAIPASQAASLSAAGEASAFLAQSTQSLVSRGERLVQQAKEAFANIDTSAIELNRQSKAQDIVIDASLRADEEIQALLNTDGIEPLTLASKTEAIIDKVSNAAVGQASSLGTEVRDFVRSKLNNLKLNKVPGVRREGFKRESDIRVAALQARMFKRKSELYAADTTDERQVQLFTETLEDIQAHAGIHLTEAQAQNLIKNEVKEFDKMVFFETLQVDPVAAQKLIPSMNLSPREQIQLEAQAQNILDAEDNRERQREADEIRAKNKRGLAMYKQITLNTVNNNRDPRLAFQDPNVTQDMSASQVQSAINFYDAKLNSANSQGNLGGFLLLKSQLRERPITPSDTAEAIIEIQNRGANFTPQQMGDLLTTGMTAWESKQSLQQTQFDKDKSRAEAKIKRNFAFEKGFISILEPDSQSQLNLAISGAIDLFHERVNDSIEEATQNNLDPRKVVNTAGIADEVMLEFLPSIKDALSSQTFASGAFNQLSGDTSLNRTRAELSKDLVGKVESGTIKMKEAQIIENLWTMHDTLRRLTAGEAKATQESIQDATQKAIAAKTGQR